MIKPLKKIAIGRYDYVGEDEKGVVYFGETRPLEKLVRWRLALRVIADNSIMVSTRRKLNRVLLQLDEEREGRTIRLMTKDGYVDVLEKTIPF